MTIDGNLSIELLSWAMDRALASHSVARLNVANANVDGFKAVSISFEQQLSALQSAANPNEIRSTLATIQQNVEEMLSHNTSITTQPVRLDAEVADLVSFSGSYQSLADAMSRKVGLMKLAITSKG